MRFGYQKKNLEHTDHTLEANDGDFETSFNIKNYSMYQNFHLLNI